MYVFNAVIIIFVYIACNFIVCNYIFALLSNTIVGLPKTKGGEVREKTPTYFGILFEICGATSIVLEFPANFQSCTKSAKNQILFFKQLNIQVDCSMFTHTQ